MRFKAKRSSEGSSSGRGSGLRLTILLATVAALLFVPAAQAFANETMKVNIGGTGNGEVTSVLFGNAFEGTPFPIECTYKTPGPATGVCENEMNLSAFGEYEGVIFRAVPSPGSEFVEFVFEEGEFECEPEQCLGYSEPPGSGGAKVKAVFACEVPGTCEEGGGGPTNRRTLTLTKSAGGSGGIGTVSSKPKGIKCAAACNEAVGSFYENSNVELSAKASTGSTFTGWTGACSGTGACVVSMTEAKAVGATFGGTSKAIVNPQELTVSKVGTGFGTVKATGLACEAECSTTTVDYQGPITLPKPKPAKTVALTAIPAFGSTFLEWGGACSGSGACEVTMNEAAEVTATFTALPLKTLTVAKNAYATGTGTVSSKPKGIKCAATCTTQSVAMPEGASVVLTEKPASGMTFVEWEGGGCTASSSPTCTTTVSASETVTAKFSGTPKAIANPQELTLTKAGSGFGTVKASGLACEVACTSAVSLYAGAITEPKPKPAATVTLEAISAPGSKTVAWSGCDSETEGKCVVTMETAKSVTATFDELP